jgi:BioD-like phosphotransacetylase family protein
MPSVEDVLKKRIQKKAAELAQAAKNLEAVLWDLSEATRAGDQRDLVDEAYDRAEKIASGLGAMMDDIGAEHFR